MFEKAFKDKKLAPENLSRTLEDSATVLSLKEAFQKKSVYTSDQFRLFYRKENGQNIGATF